MALSIASYEPANWFNNTGTARTVTGVDWSTGDIIVAIGGTENASYTLGTPTNANLTFSLQASVTAGGSNECTAYVWTATAGSSQTAQTISTTISSSGKMGGLHIWVISGSPSGTTGAAANQTETAPSLTVGAGDAVCYGFFDWNAYDGGTPDGPTKTPLTGSGTATERADTTNGVEYGIWAADWLGTSAGTFSFGPNNYTNLKIAHGYIVVQAPASSGTDADAETTGATATANNATSTVDTDAEVASATATAYDATVSLSVDAPAEVATATAAALDATTTVDTDAEVASAVATAHDATVQVDTDAESASATAAANDATVSTAGLWVPSDLATLGAWYDPSDSGARTITASAFEALDNKEGTASLNVGQSTSGSRPALSSAAINGLDAMDFDGSDDFLTHDNGWMYGAGTVTIGIIVKGTRATDAYLLTEADSTATASIYSLLKNSNTSTEYGPAAFIRNSSSTVLYAHNQHASIDFLDSPEATHLITLVDTGSNLAHYVDGASANSVGYTRSGTLTHNRFAIGALYRSTGTAAHWDGLVGEIVIATTTDSAEREKIEGYLAHKWGTAGLLDAGHPYKSAPPTSGITADAEVSTAAAAAQDATSTVDTDAETATAAAAAQDASSTVDTDAEVASAVATAHDATVDTTVTATAEVASAVATAHDATVTVDTDAEVATAVATAHDGTVSTAADTDADAEAATAAAAAQNASSTVDVDGEVASATAAAQDATAALDVDTEVASAVATAYDATVETGVAASAEVASAVATAHDATVTVATDAEVATAVTAANNPVVAATTAPSPIMDVEALTAYSQTRTVREYAAEVAVRSYEALAPTLTP